MEVFCDLLQNKNCQIFDTSTSSVTKSGSFKEFIMVYKVLIYCFLLYNVSCSATKFNTSNLFSY